MEANNSTFDLKAFLNDPKVQADKAGAVKFLQSKGIIDAQGQPIPGMSNAAPKKSELPILTNQSGGFGTALRDVSVGAVKSFVRGGRDLAGLTQSLGKGALGVFGVDTSEMGIKSIDNSTPEGAQVAQQLESKSRGEQVGTVLETVGSFGAGFASKEARAVATAGKETIQTIKAGRQLKKVGDESLKLAETISPPLTKKEVQLAQKQGRFYEGQDPTLFKAGTADQVAVSSKTADAVRTIKDTIPNASKLKPSELYTAVDDAITKKATDLAPVMKQTPIKPETIQKINDDWAALKKLQIEAADASEEANILKLQKKFEERLMKSGSNSQNDLWETRKAYDSGIPSNVKRANSLSSESLQNKKEIWLQNREILNKAITDASSGLGEAARKPFFDMSNLYEARNSLLSKTKVNKAQVSKIDKFLKENPKTSALLGGGTVYAILKNLGIPLP